MCIYEHVYGWGWVNIISTAVSGGVVRRTVFQESSQDENILMNIFTCTYCWGEAQRWCSPEL